MFFYYQRMLQVYRKIHRFCDVIYYFTNGQWYFTNTNVQQLWNKLTPQDQRLFFFNMAELNWSETIDQSMFGIRTYLMKEDPNTIPEALKRTHRWDIICKKILYIRKEHWISNAVNKKQLINIFSLFFQFSDWKFFTLQPCIQYTQLFYTSFTRCYRNSSYHHYQRQILSSFFLCN